MVFPPKWDELPKPSEQADNENVEEEIIEIIFNQRQQNSTENVNTYNPGSTESIILKRILFQS